MQEKFHAEIKSNVGFHLHRFHIRVELDVYMLFGSDEG